MEKAPETISRRQLEALLERDPEVALVEVLGPDEYRAWHLPGAIDVPVGASFDEDIQRAVPDRDRTVVVYCRDEACHASAAAARAMRRLGYREVYDDAGGEEDWRAAGLPLEA